MSILPQGGLATRVTNDFDLASSSGDIFNHSVWHTVGSNASVSASTNVVVGDVGTIAGTVPAGHTAFLTTYAVDVAATKPMDVYLFKRLDANILAAPFRAKRLVTRHTGVSDSLNRDLRGYLTFPAYTDIWWEARNSGGAAGSITVSYDLLLVKA